MLVRTKLYLLANSLFGTPTKVEPATYTRTKEIFRERTIPLLEMVKTYIPPAGRILIIGCGSGVEINWFAERAASVMAVDVSEGAVEKSRESTKSLKNVESQVVESTSLPFADHEFDVIFMHDVCEHIIHLEECFDHYYRILKTGGVLINSFAPLFYSPYGAHLQDALKMPWGHLIFGLRAVVEIRNCFYSGVSTATSWDEFGLNRVTERRYRKLVTRCGFVDEYYSVGTSKNLPLVASIPLLRNLFILQITNILRKA